MSGRLAVRALTAAVRLLPAARREFGAALLAEAAVVPPARRLRWAAGGLWYVFREVLVGRLGYGAGLALVAAAVAGVDRLGTSDDSGQVSMLVLLAGAAGLGFAVPRRAWLAGLVAGCALPVTAIALALGRPGAAHLPEQHGVAGAATLFVLVLPAVAGAYLGAGTRVLLRGR